MKSLLGYLAIRLRHLEAALADSKAENEAMRILLTSVHGFLEPWADLWEAIDKVFYPENYVDDGTTGP